MPASSVCNGGSEEEDATMMARNRGTEDDIEGEADDDGSSQIVREALMMVDRLGGGHDDGSEVDCVTEGR
jgi:hypothetical protein